MSGAEEMWSEAQQADEQAARRLQSVSAPGMERGMSRVSRAADHLVIWWAVAGAMSVLGDERLRRTAVHGLTAMAVVGPICNAVGKQVIDRDRPPADVQNRRRGRVPDSGSFPSGHTASAAAFATAVVLERPAVGAPVAALAGLVACSRVYTGAHYPADVTGGAAAGVAVAVWLHRRRRRKARRGGKLR